MLVQQDLLEEAMVSCHHSYRSNSLRSCGNRMEDLRERKRILKLLSHQIKLFFHHLKACKLRGNRQSQPSLSILKIYFSRFYELANTKHLVILPRRALRQI